MTRRAFPSLLCVLAVFFGGSAAGAQTPPTTPVPAVSKQGASDDTSLIVRFRDRYGDLSDKGIALTAGSIVAGSGLSAGIALGKAGYVGPWGAVVEARWSIRGYRLIDAQFGMTDGRKYMTELKAIDADVASTFNHNSLLAFGKAVFVHARDLWYPRVSYYGPEGVAASVDGRSDYALKGKSVDVVAQWQRYRWGASGRVGTLRLKLGTPTNDKLPDTRDLYAGAGLTGLDTQHNFRTMGGALVYDNRDLSDLTEMGTFAGVGLWRAFASGSSNSSLDWTRMNLDVLHFRPVKQGSQVVAMRGLVAARLDGGSTPTPFYLQPTLGGGKTLRGFDIQRVRDDSVWAATVEYRWRAHDRIELAPFVDAGSGARRFSDFRSASVEVTPGLGLRIVSRSKIIGRLDFARGRDGSRLIFSLGSPF